MAPVTKAPRRYFIELTGALALYFGAITIREQFADKIADPVLKDALIVLPVVPTLLMAVAIFRFFYRVDEYRRRQILESFALAAAATCIFAVCWMLLADLGLPELSIFWVWPIQACFWALIMLAFKLRDKASEGMALKTVTTGVLNIAGIAAATGLYYLAARQLGWPTRWLAVMLVATIFLLVRFGIFVFSKKSAC